MAPVLWQSTRVPLRTYDTNALNTLIGPTSSILANVKCLLVYAAPGEYKLSNDQQGLLVAILTALPRDALRSFTCRSKIDRYTFLCVIQAQRQLKELRVTLSEDLGDLSPLAPYLAAITTILIYVNRLPDKAAISCKRYHSLISNAPRLSNLELILALEDEDPSHDFQYFADIQNFSLGTAHGAARQVDLKTLKLRYLALKDSYARITNHINVMNLKELHLISCYDIQPLLAALERAFAGGKPALTHLEVCLILGDHERANGLARGIEKFLSSFSGLRTLYLTMGKFGIISKDCVIKHAATLLLFGVDAMDGRPNSYDLSELTAILDSCTKLEQLAVNLGIEPITPWTGLCKDLLSDTRSSPTTPHVATHFEASLVRLHPFALRRQSLSI